VAAFDNMKRGLAGREWHVVGHYRLGEALEGERANLFGYKASPKRGIYALTEQNLAVLGLGTKTASDRRSENSVWLSVAHNPCATPAPNPKSWPRRRNAPAASRIATAVLTAPSAGSDMAPGR
jgi:hypothetical protein